MSRPSLVPRGTIRATGPAAPARVGERSVTPGGGPRPPGSPLGIALGAALCLAAPGCYLTQAARGQLGVVFGREDLEDVLADPETTPLQRQRLELVRAVRLFGIEQVKLADTDGYTCVYDTGDDPIIYSVSGSDKDAFAPATWWFPIVGTIPYLGYFHLGPARDAASELRRAGLDAVILRVPAYSTLGWFDDPVFTSMLRWDEGTLTETILHEMTHATVWVPGDVPLNEALATFVGQKGAEAFLVTRGGSAPDPALAIYREDLRQEQLVRASLARLRADLWRVYAACGPRDDALRLRKQVVQDWRRRFMAEVRPLLTDPRFEALASNRVELGNAMLLMDARYHDDLVVFERAWTRVGGTLPAFLEALKAVADADEPRDALLELAGPPPGSGAR